MSRNIKIPVQGLTVTPVVSLPQVSVMVLQCKGSGCDMAFSTGGSGGFAGAGALREGFMNSGGFGDITINNSFTTGGTPSTLQLKQWGRVIANQVNQELGKKVRR